MLTSEQGHVTPFDHMPRRINFRFSLSAGRTGALCNIWKITIITGDASAAAVSAAAYVSAVASAIVVVEIVGISGA